MKLNKLLSGINYSGYVIPKDLDIKKLKRIFKIKKDIAGELGYDVISITQNGAKIKNITSNEGQISSDYSKYQKVEKNDFLMNHMDLLTGFVDLSKYKGVTSPDYRVFHTTDQNIYKSFFLYIFQFCYISKIFYALGRGVSKFGRWRLGTLAFENFFLPVPPFPEQRKISEFLFEKSEKIDLLIENNN